MNAGSGTAQNGFSRFVCAFARIDVGALSDRVGRSATGVACSATMGATTVLLPVADSAAGPFAFALVFGVAYGGNGALLSPLTVDLFGAANANAVFGLVSFPFAVSGLIAPWAAGLTDDAVGPYAPAFVGAGVAALFGSIIVAIAGSEGS